MLSIIVHMQTLKWVLPIGFILGSGPNLFAMFACIKLLTLPLPRRVFERGDEWVYAVYQRIILFVVEHYGGTQVVLYGDADEVMKRKENVIFISNHQSEFDWIITNMLAIRQGSLGSVRFTLKDGLRFLPLYGYYFRQHSCIYINKSGKFNESRCAKQLQDLQTYNTPIWLVVFPEGSRFVKDRKGLIQKSEDFAREQGLPVLKQHLTPRSKMLGTCLENLGNYVTAIYDVTAAYSSTLDKKTGERSVAPGLSEVAMGSCDEIHIDVRRIDIKDVPTDKEDLKTWLYERYVRKDRLLQKFYSTDPALQGCFEGQGRRSRLKLKQTLPAVLFFAGVGVPVFCTEIGRKFYSKVCIYGSIFGLAWMMMRL